MKVLQFCLADADFDIRSIVENCVCYTGTHDNDTTVGWFNGAAGGVRNDEEIKQLQRRALQLSEGTPATIHEDLTRLAFSSRARLAIVPMQDYLGLGSAARLNIPGTSQHNWRWRLQDQQVAAPLRERIRNLVARSGRAANRDIGRCHG
jgi:4-alpha-glucanotransferase